MKNRTRLLALAGVGLAATVGKRTIESRRAERVPYETVEEGDDVELRRYPRCVLVETTAPTETAAFRRLAEYIGGENEGVETVSMTAPVRTGSEAGGVDVPMTAPVRTDEGGEGVRMAFYLPSSYDAANAPLPTDPAVRLIVEPSRTLAVSDFSWFATDDRVEHAERRLREALDEWGVEPHGEAVLLRYDPPWTLPFLRTNEVAVEVRAAGE
ncbi:SOUL family heme-binding protein [Natronorarus salvus]|uniref:SOUL family heme-binding protein n=1 Tax=Natronorarus salvus TaxID=3117733 RepID=UPI002F265DFB